MNSSFYLRQWSVLLCLCCIHDSAFLGPNCITNKSASESQMRASGQRDCGSIFLLLTQLRRAVDELFNCHHNSSVSLDCRWVHSYHRSDCFCYGPIRELISGNTINSANAIHVTKVVRDLSES